MNTLFILMLTIELSGVILFIYVVYTMYKHRKTQDVGIKILGYGLLCSSIILIVTSTIELYKSL